MAYYGKAGLMLFVFPFSLLLLISFFTLFFGGFPRARAHARVFLPQGLSVLYLILKSPTSCLQLQSLGWSCVF